MNGAYVPWRSFEWIYVKDTCGGDPNQHMHVCTNCGYLVSVTIWTTLRLHFVQEKMQSRLLAIISLQEQSLSSVRGVSVTLGLPTSLTTWPSTGFDSRRTHTFCYPSVFLLYKISHVCEREIVDRVLPRARLAIPSTTLVLEYYPSSTALANKCIDDTGTS